MADDPISRDEVERAAYDALNAADTYQRTLERTCRLPAGPRTYWFQRAHDYAVAVAGFRLDDALKRFELLYAGTRPPAPADRP